MLDAVHRMVPPSLILLICLAPLVGSLSTPQNSFSRRGLLLQCGCYSSACLSWCAPPAVLALTAVTPVDDPLAAPRDAFRDESFAGSMANGMKSYEKAIEPTKRRIFDQMLRRLPAEDATVVELGVGTFPNAPYYAAADGTEGMPRRMDIVGVDPK